MKKQVNPSAEMGGCILLHQTVVLRMMMMIEMRYC